MGKVKYLWVVQGDYGDGWEDVTAHPCAPEGRQAARADRDAYREAEPSIPHRTVRKRETE